VEAKLQQMNKLEVPSRLIGDLVIEGLKNLDQIAYIRYAIVYLPLTNLKDIQAEINHLLESKGE
jgi:transcriptional repressor NrdR